MFGIFKKKIQERKKEDARIAKYEDYCYHDTAPPKPIPVLRERMSHNFYFRVEVLEHLPNDILYKYTNKGKHIGDKYVMIPFDSFKDYDSTSSVVVFHPQSQMADLIVDNATGNIIKNRLSASPDPTALQQEIFRYENYTD